MIKISQLKTASWFYVAVFSFFMSGCSSLFSGHSSSSWSRDGAPSRDVDVTGIPNAVPIYEEITAAGNRSPYKVLGKTYHINFQPEGFSQTGYASWYGTKFHGRNTANGEVYDMYAMTAAHKTLPIPSYARVVNQENGKSIVVRINDRGPFHEGRVIDLSYVAAKKLDIIQKGTGKVLVEAIIPTRIAVDEKAKNKKLAGSNLYLQVGAFRQYDSANNLKSKLKSRGHTARVHHDQRRHLYKVLVGPFVDEEDLPAIRRSLKSSNIHNTYLVQY